MQSELEHLAEGRIILIDNSFLSTGENSLCEWLYDSRWDEIETEKIDKEIVYINLLEDFLAHSNVKVISETLKEAAECVKQLNCHATYINHRATRYKGKIRKISNRQREITKRKEIIGEGENYSAYQTYVDKFYELFSKLRKCDDPRDSFLSGQKRIYEYFLKRTRALPQDVHSIFKKINYKKPLFLREELDTDRKIVATAFTLAYANNVLVLTRDNDILGFINKMYEESYEENTAMDGPYKESVITFGIRKRNGKLTQTISSSISPFSQQPIS